jgi:HNH endonuclease
MSADTTIRKLCRENGLALHINGGHYQVRGSILVNYYPLARKPSMYVAGTVQGIDNATPQMVVNAALGREIPKTLRLTTVKAGRRKSYASAKRRLFKITQVCFWCRRQLTLVEATVDHVIPLSRGGMNNANNYVLACQPCNNKRGNTIPTPAQRPGVTK